MKFSEDGFASSIVLFLLLLFNMNDSLFAAGVYRFSTRVLHPYTGYSLNRVSKTKQIGLFTIWEPIDYVGCCVCGRQRSSFSDYSEIPNSAAKWGLGLCPRCPQYYQIMPQKETCIWCFLRYKMRFVFPLKSIQMVKASYASDVDLLI